MRATTIDSGRRVPVTSVLFTGERLAGIRETTSGGDYSLPGEVPLGQQAYAGTVDGREVRILGARASAADKSMMVVTFAWTDAK